MNHQFSKNSSPRIKIIQKIYGSLMNPDEEIKYPKSQYKKYIKDIVSGTIERIDLIEETILTKLEKDIDLKKTDKLLKIILFSAVFELMFKHNIPKNVIISEYVDLANDFGAEKGEKFVNGVIDKVANIIRK